ncbi:tyrosine-type recombinase/integrase [Sorangium sp. So ce1151]|uniref:tyrosine-type recombinase/integrase n=1 Tax=Sorangium sp. So ce1151 TaxID=3133332 RepID=UPI003F619063
MPCRAALLKAPKPDKGFLGFDELDRLVEGARKVGWGAHLMMLLGAEAGLRRDEMISLRWGDVDLVRAQVHIRRADWNGIESTPKGGRGRIVDLTQRLAAALKAHRHLPGDRVLCEDDGSPITGRTVARWMWQATRRAGLAVLEGPHILRHTFCSHLAMRGAPVMAIRDGHHGARRAPRRLEDDGLHAPVAEREAERNSAARRAARRGGPWRNTGTGEGAGRKGQQFRAVTQWVDRDSNPGPTD